MYTPLIALAIPLLACCCSATAQDLVTAINPNDLAQTTQNGYSQASLTAPGARTLFVSGQVGFVEGEDNGFEAQVDRAFDNLRAAIEAAGGRVEDVVKITLLIKDHNADRLAYLGKKRASFFGPNFPASTLIPVTRLYADGVAFEIDATVAVAAD